MKKRRPRFQKKSIRDWIKILLSGITLAGIVVAALNIMLNNNPALYLYEESVGYRENSINILMLLPSENNSDISYFYTVPEFEKAGFGVEVASTSKGWIKGERIYVHPQLTLEEVNASKYDALVIPGGDGVKMYFWHNKEILDIVEEFNKENKTIASICSGSIILLQAGVLAGKNGTCSVANSRMFELGGSKLLYDPVVVSKNIITANEESNAREFALAVIEKLRK